MTIQEKLELIKNEYNLTISDIAEITNASPKTVKKWLAGTAYPDTEQCKILANTCKIDLASLLDDNRSIHDTIFKVVRNLESIPDWEKYSTTVMIEYKQCFEEGKDVEEYEQFFQALAKMPESELKEKFCDDLYEFTLSLKQRETYKFLEPDELQRIKELRNTKLLEEIKPVPNKEVLADKIKGAWYGRIAGCMLGKTVEGMKRHELIPFLKVSKNYPMHRYILSSDVTDKLVNTYKFNLKNRPYADKIEFEPVDDDTNYTVLYQDLISRYGYDFTPYRVSRHWLQKQNKDAYCTAERVAFVNFINGYIPHNSALYKNAFREWIGAQIRADYFGYINPGNPELAAEMAWRDASISHVKNGIYGEMFVAAMIACAAVEDDIEKIILGGLAQIPKTSRLYEAVMHVLEEYRKGSSADAVERYLIYNFNDRDAHDWCHTISNAVIVVFALLFRKCDYGRSICLAVQTGFDTDCNGATVGSILGMRNGYHALDPYWFEPMHGILDTSIFGIGKVEISSLVDKTLEHIEENPYLKR